MAKTLDIGPLFFQLLSVKKGTPFYHKAIQSQEIDEPYRKATPIVVRLPLTVRPYFYKLWGWLNDDPVVTGFQHGFTIQFNRALAVGFWRKTGYEEHEALAHALNLDDAHANDQATDFETAASGLNNDSTELGKSSEPFTVRGTGDGTDAGSDVDDSAGA